MVYAATSEGDALDLMEPRWRKLGYTLIREPKGEQLPSFLRGFAPDAIAMGPEPALVIEVLHRQSPSAETKVRQLRDLLDDQEGWRLEVVFVSPDGAPLESVTFQEIRAALAEARSLSERDTRAGLLMAWATLEAIGRQLEPGLAMRSLSTGSLIDLLISTGHAPQVEGALLRRMGDLRNVIAHGQINLEPEPSDVRRLIELAEEIID